MSAPASPRGPSLYDAQAALEARHPCSGCLEAPFRNSPGCTGPHPPVRHRTPCKCALCRVSDSSSSCPCLAGPHPGLLRRRLSDEPLALQLGRAAVPSTGVLSQELAEHWSNGQGHRLLQPTRQPVSRDCSLSAAAFCTESCASRRLASIPMYAGKRGRPLVLPLSL